MSYLVTCAFDLKNATAQNYQTAYDDLGKMGLKKVIIAGAGNNVVVLTTTVIGTFTGVSPTSVLWKTKK